MRWMGFVQKLQEAIDGDCSFLNPVLSQTDSGDYYRSVLEKLWFLREEF